MGGIVNDHTYNSRQRSLTAVTSFCIIVSTLAAGLRLYARRKLHIKFWWDDSIAVVALVSLATWSRLGRPDRSANRSPDIILLSKCSHHHGHDGRAGETRQRHHSAAGQIHWGGS